MELAAKSEPEGVVHVVKVAVLCGVAPAAIAWMNNYCAQHPLDTLTEATRHLMDEIVSRQKSN